MRIAILNLTMRTVKSGLKFPQFDSKLPRERVRAEYPMVLLVADEMAKMGHEVDVYSGSVYEVVRDSEEGKNRANVIYEKESMRLLFPSYYYPYAPSISSELKEGNYEVVLTSEFVQPASVQAMRARNKNTDLFIWQELASHPRFPISLASRSVFLRVRMNGFASFNKAIPRSKKASAFLRSQGIPDISISRVVPNAVDCRTFSPVQEKDFFEQRMMNDVLSPRILLAARIVKGKGIDTFLTAASIVHRAAPDVSFVIKGTGPDMESVKQMANRLGIQKRVFFIEDFLPRTEFANLVASCDICAAPSTQDLLFFIPLEAIASGVPVVTTTGSHHTETFADGRAGIVVPANDSKALAEALLTLINDRPRLERMSVAARDLAVSEYSSEKVANSLLEIFSGR